MAILINKDSKIVIQGITGREAFMVTRHALVYGTKIIAGVTPGKGGQILEGIPVYDTLRDACKKHEIDTTVVYVPPEFVCDAVMEAIGNGMKTILIITERVPRLDVARFLKAAEGRSIIVGPNSAGIINPHDRIKLGPLGGDNVERSFVPGEVGVISRSGGMTAECSWMVKRAGYGVSTSISIGGDPLIGSSPREILRLFEADTYTKAVVLWGEPGTHYEEEVAGFIRSGGFTKPLVAYVAGKFVESMPKGTVFGHAASIISGEHGRPTSKIAKLLEAGAYVPDRFDDIPEILKQILQ